MVLVFSSTVPTAIPQRQIVVPLVDFHNRIAIKIAHGQAPDVVFVTFAPSQSFLLWDRQRRRGTHRSVLRMGLMHFDNDIIFTPKRDSKTEE